jgi:sugar-specific transcriptional regulator TrmB
MPDTSVTAELEALGLTSYEARIFAALTHGGESTVGELHRAARVPRSAIYEVLERLVLRRIVEEAPGRPRRFKALPPDDALRILERSFSESSGRARKALRLMVGPGPKSGRDEVIWLTRGDDNIRRKVLELVRSAKKRIVAAGTMSQHVRYMEEWKAAARRVPIEFVTETGGDRRNIAVLRKLGKTTVIRFPRPEGETRHEPMLLLTDDRFALFTFPTSRGGDAVESMALWSSADPFVAFLGFMLQYVIKGGKKTA